MGTSIILECLQKVKDFKGIFLCILVCLPLSLSSQIKIDSIFDIKGSIQGIEDQECHLIYYAVTAGKNIELKEVSSKIENGTFQLKGISYEPTLARFFYGNNDIVFYIEPVKMSLQIMNAEIGTYKLSGSRVQDEYEILNWDCRGYDECIDSLKRLSSIDVSEQIDSVKMLKNELAWSYIQTHPTSFYSILLFPEIPFYKYPIDSIKGLYEALSPEIRNSARGLSIWKNIMQYDNIQIGKIAPNFFARDWHGDEFELYSCKGRILLLDFWASWCKPCLQLTEELKLLSKKHVVEDFQIIGVSVDTSVENWVKAIESKNLGMWIQLLCEEKPSGDKGECILDSYPVYPVPRLILIDSKMRIAQVWVGYSTNMFDDVEKAVQQLITDSK